MAKNLAPRSSPSRFPEHCATLPHLDGTNPSTLKHHGYDDARFTGGETLPEFMNPIRWVALAVAGQTYNGQGHPSDRIHKLWERFASSKSRIVIAVMLQGGRVCAVQVWKSSTMFWKPRRGAPGSQILRHACRILQFHKRV